MINKKIFQTTFALIIIFELLSLNAFLFEKIMPYCFFAILAITLVLTVKNLKYGIYMLFTELAIGSLGYLFWFEIQDFKISIRVGLWLILMTVWFLKFLFSFKLNKVKELLVQAKTNTYIFWLILLLFFVFWGLLNGYLQGNSLKNIFLDFNAWLFFSIFFPCFYVLRKNKGEEIKNEILSILVASILFVSLKTLAILYIFSHNFSFLPEIYRWIRDTRVGEITKMDSGFVRVFFQSHIYMLVAFFAVFTPLLFSKKTFQIFKESRTRTLFFLASLFLSIIVLGYSRSNWLGLALGVGILFLFSFFLTFKKNSLRASIKNFIQNFIIFGASFIISVSLIAVVINFPFPGNGGGLNAVSLVSERATNIKSEAGASSRWQLLPVLWKEITDKPVSGKGFGSTVTYTSNDPRVRENNSSGEYTTYAFEWGWLDIWLKIGFFGFLVYLLFLFSIVRNYLRLSYKLVEKKKNDTDFLYFSFVVGLIVISCVNVFSPYLNHPLGIAYIVLIFLLFNKHFHKNKTIL